MIFMGRIQAEPQKITLCGMVLPNDENLKKDAIWSAGVELE